jgi:hypothetical protein
VTSTRPADRDFAELTFEIGDDAGDLDRVEPLGQPFEPAAERRLADVDGDVARPQPRGKRGAEESAGLVGAAGAELDHRVGLGEPHDLRDVPVEEQPLPARQQVLGQRTDRLEELRAALVPEPARANRAGAPGEPLGDVAGERRPQHLVREQRADLDHRARLPPSAPDERCRFLPRLRAFRRTSVTHPAQRPCPFACRIGVRTRVRGQRARPNRRVRATFRL